MDEWILFIVCMNQFEFGAPWDVLGHEDIFEAASMVPWDPMMIHG
jgi:hypothetical protein